MNKRPTYHPLVLLQRWLQGDTRKAEEQELERLAQDDPFLREAMEGYRSLPEGEHTERVHHLKARARERSRQKRSGLFYLRRIAAAVAVLAVLGGAFWYFNQNAPGATVALEERAPEQSAARPAEEGSPAEKDTKRAEEALAPEREESFAFSGETANATEPPVGQPSKARTKSSPQPPAVAESQEAEKAMAADEAPVSDRPDLPRPAEMEAGSTAQYFTTLSRPPQSPKPLSGVVVTADGQPLPGARVSVPDRQATTVTDHQGQFTLPLDSTPSELLVQYEGFDSFRTPVAQQDSLAIVYPNGAALALQEEQKTKYYPSSSFKKERARTQPYLPAPQPQGGFSGLERYIEKNLRYPAAARREKIEGEVELSFYIQPDGSLTDFQAEKNPGYGTRAEAVRLLKEGPKWEGAGQRASYTIHFELD